MKLVILVAFIVVALSGVFADEFEYLCSCFQPKWDRGCCYEVGGVSKYDGNICTIPQHDTKKYNDFDKCCSELNGKKKCKPGYFATST
ncbi:hypothetical protein BD560DRAFT_412133 [Blakeslea trispora]|nr:hypothetical protein BD560DRAFT_412133 [Blakeslea trispora]